jgi:hypothetical protein
LTLIVWPVMYLAAEAMSKPDHLPPLIRWVGKEIFLLINTVD